ncbi:MAG: class F sortase [Pseudonocardiaceae bacterium]
MNRILGLLFAVVALAGCSATTGENPPHVTTPRTSVTSASVANPATVNIPKISAHSTLIPLGLDDQGALQVPDVHHPEQAGWYSHGVKPGQIGPAIIVGHVDGAGRAGVFYRLNELVAGDEINVGLVDGRTLAFKVSRVETVQKNDFPTSRVYGNVDQPALRLVTCGGQFDLTRRSYLSNVIVYADIR